ILTQPVISQRTAGLQHSVPPRLQISMKHNQTAAGQPFSPRCLQSSVIFPNHSQQGNTLQRGETDERVIIRIAFEQIKAWQQLITRLRSDHSSFRLSNSAPFE
ncbi:hypothetical protein KUCAC02_032594, partial [Chaenocephalus aceratus]